MRRTEAPSAPSKRVASVAKLCAYYRRSEARVDEREAFRLSSPSSYLDDVTAPIQIHHGTADDTAPVRWATRLAADLRDHGKDVELFIYPGAGHSFGIGGAAYTAMMARSIAFFDGHLKAGN